MVAIPFLESVFLGKLVLINDGNRSFSYPNSYLSDTSSAEWKTLRFVFAECALYVGGPLGVILGGLELDYLGFKGVFVASMSLGAACVMYSLCLLRNDTHTRSDAHRNLLDKESYENPNALVTFESKLTTLFLRYIKVWHNYKIYLPLKQSNAISPIGLISSVFPTKKRT